MTRIAAVKAYKFIRSEHIPSLRRGEVRLCSTREIWAAERKGAGFADPNDGANRWTPGEGLHTITPDHPFAKSIGLDLTTPRVFAMGENTSLVVASYGVVFSASLERSAVMAERMFNEFQYDASYEITDFESFSRALVKAVAPEDWIAGSIHYQDDDASTTEVFSRDVLTKGTDYEWQKEIRAFLEGNFESHICKVPGLWRFIRNVRRHP